MQLAKLQMSGLRCIDGLARAAREQIRNRERMRTLEVVVGRHHATPTVLVEAHFERLVRPKHTSAHNVLLASKFF